MNKCGLLNVLFLIGLLWMCECSAFCVYMLIYFFAVSISFICFCAPIIFSSYRQMWQSDQAMERENERASTAVVAAGTPWQFVSQLSPLSTARTLAEAVAVAAPALPGWAMQAFPSGPQYGPLEGIVYSSLSRPTSVTAGPCCCCDANSCCGFFDGHGSEFLVSELFDHWIQLGRDSDVS